MGRGLMRLLAVWLVGAISCVALAAAIYYDVPPYSGLLYLFPGFWIWAEHGMAWFTATLV